MILPAAEPGVNFIYALYDPREPEEYRYIGKAANPGQRLKFHKHEKYPSYKCNWVQKLKKEGTDPVMKVLLKVGDDWGFWEERLIKFYREKGHRLTNLTDGGEGVTATPEIRAKIGAAHRGKHVSQETREKLRQANLGKKLSTATKEKMRKAVLGRKHRPESIEKMSRVQRGRKASPETRKKLSEAHKGLPGHSPSKEVRERIASKLRGQKRDPEVNRKAWETRKANALANGTPIMSEATRQKISKGMKIARRKAAEESE